MVVQKDVTYDEIVNITLGFVFSSEIDDVNSDFFYCKKQNKYTWYIN